MEGGSLKKTLTETGSGLVEVPGLLQRHAGLEWLTAKTLLVGMGFWCMLCHNYNEEPQNSLGNCLGPYGSS